MPVCDFIIRGASVIDGSGSPGRGCDVAVDRDRIVAVGDCNEWRCDSEIQAAGLTLAPGFIDSHTHDDLAVLENPELPCKMSQGVTTVVAGNCGISLAPLEPVAQLPPPFPLLGETSAFRFPSVGSYREAFTSNPAGVNLALLAGHSSLRIGAMGADLACDADPSALDKMRERLRESLRHGCIGMSTGLDYPPAAAASTGEVIALAEVLREFDRALYVTHMRDEADEVVAAVQETLQIGRSAAVPVVISHKKCAGANNYGRSRETLSLIDAAVEQQQSVAFDVYPYTASSTSLLPQFVREAEAVLVVDSEPFPEYNGMMLETIAQELGCSFEEACERLYPAAAIYFEMDNRDLERIMSHPLAMIGSDGIPSMARPHPRLWGTFPRVLGHYARDKQLFDLATAVHKMTGLTASRFGLDQRGRIEVGNYADLVLFDAERIIDRATFEQPDRICRGIVSVWVNGDLSWQKDAPTGIRNGRFLTH